MGNVPRAGDVSARPAIALIVGFACWGADALSSGMRGWSARVGAAAAAAPNATIERPLPPGRIRARGLLVGVAAVLAPLAALAIARAQALTGPPARSALRLARPMARLPGVRRVVGAADALLARAEAVFGELAAVGEREVARCQRLAEASARDLAGELAAAVAQATEVREVLVEQSAGLATEALDEVRARAREADDLIAVAARSLVPWRWRRAPRGRLRGGAAEGRPPALGAPEPGRR
jgi:hypothetical protein